MVTREVSVAECLRAGRALLRRVNALPDYLPSKRVLVHIRWARGEKGTCKWCGLQCKPLREWHRFCAKVYLVARGQVRHAGTARPLIRHRPCEQCGANGTEVDHRIALGVAARLPRHVWARAWWIGNLRWLCHKCHVAKTASDRRLMTLLDGGAMGRKFSA